MKKLKKSIFKILLTVTATMMVTTPAFAETTAQTNTGTSIIEQIKNVANTVSRNTITLNTDTTSETVFIKDATELKTILGSGTNSTYVAGKTYQLSANITWSSSNGDFVPVAEFNGVFNGDGHKITNLKIAPSSGNDAGFVIKLAQGATIENVTFENCTVTGNNRAGMVAAESYGTIRGVMVTGGKVVVVNAATTRGLVGGGLVGDFAMKDSKNADKDTLATGAIINCLYSGNIVATGTGGVDTDIPATTNQGKIGGLIGNIDKNSVDAITYSYWDMAKSPAIVKPLGNITSNSPQGAAGIQMAISTTLKLGGEQASQTLGEIVTTNPTISLVNSNYIAWSVTDDTPAGCVVYENGTITGKSVGTATLNCTITVGEFTLPLTCKVTVEGDKTALKEKLDLATEYQNLQDKSHYDTYAPGALTELNTAITNGNTVYTEPLSSDTQINDATTALNTVIEKLIEADKKLLAEKMAEVKNILDNEKGNYESLSELSSSYTLAEEISKRTTVTSADIRTAINDMDTKRNNLKILLQTPLTIERVEDDGAPYVKITITGYVKKAADGVSSLGISSDATIVSVSTGATSKDTAVEGATFEINAGTMTIKVPKTAVGVKAYNLQTVYNVVISDTIDGRTMQSAKTPVTLEKKPNYVTGHVENVDLGKVSLGSRYSNLNVTGVPVSYNPDTGEEDGKTTSGEVISWEYDRDTALANGALPEVTEIDWTKTGIKYLVGQIKEPADGRYTNPDLYKVKATVEVIDKTLLDALIGEVNGYKEANYLKETWTPFNLALTDAKSVNNSKEAGQAEIDAAYTALQTAVDGLKSQPSIVLKEESINLGIGDIFEPLLYVRSLTDVIDAPKGGDVGENILFENLVVTTGEGENAQVVYQNGKLVNPLDTSKTSTHKVTYTVTNTKGVSAAASLTVNVFGEGSSSDNTGSGSGSNSGGSGSGGTSGGNVVAGSNTVSNGTVIIEFTGTDLFTDEEIAKGAKLVIETTKITDETNILAVLEKLASVLKGEVTIDGIYDVTIYKEVNGQKTKISNSDIKNFVTLYLPISQKAVDSKDYAVIHILQNGGYDLLKGSIKEVDGKTYIAVRTKSFSEYGVVYGGSISNVADTMDTSDGNTTSAGGSGTGQAQGGADSSSGVAQGGADGGTVLVETGDASIIIAVAATALISMAACVIILFKKHKYNK